MELNKVKISVCVLAHNEERNISRTLSSILNTERSDFNITVYSNGCTDRTNEVVQLMSESNSRIKNVEIKIPSKVNAWNTAFQNHDDDILIFCDGDVVPEKNAVDQLVKDLTNSPNRVLVSTRLFPITADASLDRKLVGFMQLPLKHEFLSGGMYAFKRSAMLERLKLRNLEGIPSGITGEDYFLEHIVADGTFYVSKVRNYYEPAELKDYIRYLARIKWQNKQMQTLVGDHPDVKLSMIAKIKRKLSGHHEISYLLSSIPAVMLRIFFKVLYSKKINEAFYKLGPIVADGENILRINTRANSTK